jgi:hypothetical protein
MLAGSGRKKDLQISMVVQAGDEGSLKGYPLSVDKPPRSVGKPLFLWFEDALFSFIPILREKDVQTVECV